MSFWRGTAHDKELKMDFKPDETTKPAFDEEEKRILRHLKGHLTSPKVASRSQNSGCN